MHYVVYSIPLELRWSISFSLCSYPTPVNFIFMFFDLSACSFPENKTVYVWGHASICRTVRPADLFGFGGRLSTGVVVDIWRAPGRVWSGRVCGEHWYENQSVVDRQYRLRSPGKLHVPCHESRRPDVLYGRLKRTRYQYLRLVCILRESLRFSACDAYLLVASFNCFLKYMWRIYNILY